MTYNELKYKIMERMGDNIYEVCVEHDYVEICVVLPDDIDVSLYIECRIDNRNTGIIDVTHYGDTLLLSRCIDIIIEFARTPLEERYDDEEEI